MSRTGANIDPYALTPWLQAERARFTIHRYPVLGLDEYQTIHLCITDLLHLARLEYGQCPDDLLNEAWWNHNHQFHAHPEVIEVRYPDEEDQPK